MRKVRLADQIKDVLATTFAQGRVNDPRVQGITITHVRLTADLQLATVYFRAFEGSNIEEVQAGLTSCHGMLRNVLADQLLVRRVPELRFYYDESIERGAHIEKLLDQVGKGE